MSFKRKKTLIVLLVLVSAGSMWVFITKEPLGNPPVTGEIRLPDEVQAILERSCPKAP